MHLDIEGTKHEKVVIIVLAYVMGFTAGFIFFGIAAPRSHQESNEFNERTGSVMAAPAVEPEAMATPDTSVDAPSDAQAAPEATNDGTVSVSYTAGKLKAHVGTNEFLLSMKASNLDSAAVVTAFKNQGLHADIPAYSVSPDSKFIYFCEQQGIEDSCTNFIFDIAKNVINYVQLDGKKVTTTGAVAKAATWSAAGLTLDGKTSADPTAPALLSAE